MRIKLLVLVGLALISGIGLLGYAYAGENDGNQLSESEIRFCQNSQQQYVLVGEEKYLKMYDYDFLSQVCVMLYNDPLWDYSGDHKMNKLVEKSENLILVSQSNEESKVNELKEINQLKKQNISLLQRLEHHKQMVDELETQIEDKNSIIREQTKVILSLSSRGN